MDKLLLELESPLLEVALFEIAVVLAEDALLAETEWAHGLGGLDGVAALAEEDLVVEVGVFLGVFGELDGVAGLEVGHVLGVAVEGFAADVAGELAGEFFSFFELELFVFLEMELVALVGGLGGEAGCVGRVELVDEAVSAEVVAGLLGSGWAYQTLSTGDGLHEGQQGQMRKLMRYQILHEGLGLEHSVQRLHVAEVEVGHLGVPVARDLVARRHQLELCALALACVQHARHYFGQLTYALAALRNLIRYLQRRVWHEDRQHVLRPQPLSHHQLRAPQLLEVRVFVLRHVHALLVKRGSLGLRLLSPTSTSTSTTCLLHLRH